ncbi:GNAT family N-acetyltransferase [Paenibacillus sp. FSL H7-0714]|uniref:GNAT family N-acetyltransferase n=1 Tax=Paenibacillus sp. FSL H7-0714 TaxID=2954735 RepID=UPI0030F9E5F2
MGVTTNSISIVRGEPDRVSDILRLLQEAAGWMELNGINQWTPGQFNEVDISGYFADRHVYLSLDDGVVVGMFTLQFSDPQYWGSKNDESYAYLHRLAVAGSHRSQGLGQYMLKYAVVRASELGCRGLRFDTVAHNIKLNRYYQSLGFYYMGTNDMGNGRLVNLYEHFTENFDEDAVILRYFSEADFEFLKRCSNTAEFLKQWAGSTIAFPLDDEQLNNYLAGANHPAESDRLIYCAVHVASQKVVGHISISTIDRINRSARIEGVVVDPKCHRRGIGSRMINGILRIGFDGLGLYRLSLGVYDFNIVALKTCESVGFKREGIQREAALFGERYVDCIEMSMLDREWRGKIQIKQQ